LGQALQVVLPDSVRGARLRGSTGRSVTIRSLRGKVIVLSDLLTLCQETCPLDTANVVAAARQVEAAGLGTRVVFLSVTVDPQRDTPRRLEAYHALYRPAPSNWLTLTGSPATLTAFWKQLGVFVRRVRNKPPLPHDWLTGRPLHYDVTHSDAVIFLDRSGQERFVLTGSPHVAAGAPIPPQLRRFLSDRGSRNLTHPDPQAWTLEQELSVISWLVGERV
jgi:protein SCO1/2